ncbi:Ig-like domain-containing protein [Massilia sp. erpn]|uniref:Ig-like domain-containing protein n=1 Tax=Massilia sp. erpn TaxID=2738142 RepID=UPI002103EF04|nr:Ig-like domain-containing protein [Massilia sp. erpn]UTY56220.1 DUF4214 domain-containing protein [Massilia sp. erpn]
MAIHSTSFDALPSPAPSTPDLPEVWDSWITHDNLTNFASAHYIGSATPNSLVKLYNGDTLISSTTANASGKYEFQGFTLQDGLYHLQATETGSDGVESARSGTLDVTIDTKAPAPPTPVLAAISHTGGTGVDDATNHLMPTFSGVTEPNALVGLFAFERGLGDMGSVYADANGFFTIQCNKQLPEKTVTVYLRVMDMAKNSAMSAVPLKLLVDATKPATLANLDLADSSDSGWSATDNITNAAAPVFAGSGAEAGATVRLFAGAQQVGSATADASGNWSAAAANVAEGRNIVFTVDQVDRAGNISELRSAPLSVTIDRTAAAAPGLELSSASDSGVSASDKITSALNPEFTGAAEAGAAVRLYAGTQQVGTTTTDASGHWSITVANAAAGRDIAFSVEQEDAAGNISARSPVMKVTIDREVATLGAPDLAASSDSGSSATDNLTNAANPVFTGSGGEVGATVRLFAGNVQAGSALVDANGNWSVTATGVGAGSNIPFTVEQVDKAGNISARSAALSVSIDRSVVAPGVPDLAAQSDSGISASDNLTNAVNPVFTGSGGEAGATIRLYAGTAQVGSGTVDASGNWSVTALNPAAGSNIAFTVDQVDLAGNISAHSAALNVNIDRTGPGPFTDTNGAANQLYAGSGYGTSTGVTAKATDAVTGSYSLSYNPGGIFAINANTGEITLANSNALGQGSYTVTVQAQDAAGNTGSGNYSITALPPYVPNRPPSAGDDTPYTNTGVRDTTDRSSLYIAISDLMKNDNDPDGPIYFSGFQSQVGGTVQQSGNYLIFTPMKGFNGKAQFSYTITDGQYSDTATVSFNVSATSNPFAHASDMQKLYVAIFNRAADAGGLKWYVEQWNTFPNTLNIDELAKSLYESREGLDIGWKALDNTSFVKKIYDNLFDRGGDLIDQGGLQFWVNALNNGLERHKAFAAIYGGAAAADKQVANNKILAAEYLTHSINTPGEQSGVWNQWVMNNFIEGVKTEADLFNARLHANETVAQLTGQPLDQTNLNSAYPDYIF